MVSLTTSENNDVETSQSLRVFGVVAHLLEYHWGKKCTFDARMVKTIRNHIH